MGDSSEFLGCLVIAVGGAAMVHPPNNLFWRQLHGWGSSYEGFDSSYKAAPVTTEAVCCLWGLSGPPEVPCRMESSGVASCSSWRRPRASTCAQAVHSPRGLGARGLQASCC